jgi:hypothetical protein
MKPDENSWSSLKTNNRLYSWGFLSLFHYIRYL